MGFTSHSYSKEAKNRMHQNQKISETDVEI